MSNSNSVQIRVNHSIDQIPAGQWNALVKDNNPFLKHQFLAALEHNDCVGERFGWRPTHLTIWQDETLIAASPLYLKDNSYGEFVFDHAWADAYQRHGLNYFPKLVAAIPYTPATGERLLVAQGHPRESLQGLLAAKAVDLCNEYKASSMHWLFVSPREQHQLEKAGFLQRLGVQFHWQNHGYQDFNAFLAELNAKRRKNIRRERRIVQESGFRVRLLHGGEVNQDQWRLFARFYAKTFEERLSLATLNAGFFSEIGQTLDDQVILLLAYDHKGSAVAGALLLKSDTTLYGRHWGCEQDHDNLHFEVCYYRGIEYAIAKGLQRFEPGAQGEHKIWRGFLPTLTHSYHWIVDEQFRGAISDFLQREKPAILDYKSQLDTSSPFRHSSSTPSR